LRKQGELHDYNTCLPKDDCLKLNDGSFQSPKLVPGRCNDAVPEDLVLYQDMEEAEAMIEKGHEVYRTTKYHY
jgi:hypothetical protein